MNDWAKRVRVLRAFCGSYDKLADRLNARGADITTDALRMMVARQQHEHAEPKYRNGKAIIEEYDEIMGTLPGVKQP